MDKEIRKLYFEYLFSKKTFWDMYESSEACGIIPCLTVMAALIIGCNCTTNTYHVISTTNTFLRITVSTISGIIGFASPWLLISICDWWRLKRKARKFDLLNHDQVAELINWREEQINDRRKETFAQIFEVRKQLEKGLALAGEFVTEHLINPSDELVSLHAKQAEEIKSKLQEMLSNLEKSEIVWLYQLQDSTNQLAALREIYKQSLEAKKLRDLVKLEADAEKETALLLQAINRYLVSERGVCSAMDDLVTNAKSYSEACTEYGTEITSCDPRTDEVGVAVSS